MTCCCNPTGTCSCSWTPLVIQKVPSVTCIDLRHSELEAENARLRAALQRIAMRCQNCDEGNEYATCICFSEPFADQIARAALEGK